MSTMKVPKGVLLDLDGTLLDTAPDMVAALNPICHRLGVAAPDYEFARDYVSMGATGLLRVLCPTLMKMKLRRWCLSTWKYTLLIWLVTRFCLTAWKHY